jgi:hypothetical protein
MELHAEQPARMVFMTIQQTFAKNAHILAKIVFLIQSNVLNVLGSSQTPYLNTKDLQCYS